MLDNGGESNRVLVALVAILAIALVIVMYLWMQDRESQDLRIEVGSRVVQPALPLG